MFSNSSPRRESCPCFSMVTAVSRGEEGYQMGCNDSWLIYERIEQMFGSIIACETPDWIGKMMLTKGRQWALRIPKVGL